MSDQGNRRSPRVWTAEEINQQLDEVAEALIQGSHEFVRGFLFGVPVRRKPKPVRSDRRRTMASDKPVAARIVTGVIAGMVAATAVATAVGFWLSYAGLHDFALRAGLHGPEAWAWPASVDLFILAGEAGVTISALRRHEDWQAWAYLAIGFGASVTANILHVDPADLFWTRYAVAAVPPVAAMLALAALLRQVYRLAAEPAPVTASAAKPKAGPGPHSYPFTECTR